MTQNPPRQKTRRASLTSPFAKGGECQLLFPGLTSPFEKGGRGDCGSILRRSNSRDSVDSRTKSPHPFQIDRGRHGFISTAPFTEIISCYALMSGPLPTVRCVSPRCGNRAALANRGEFSNIESHFSHFQEAFCGNFDFFLLF